MKICWDNLEGIYLTIYGNFRFQFKKDIYEIRICKYCGDEFLARKYRKEYGIYCDKSCAMSKENNPNYGEILSEKHRQKISISNSGVNGFWYDKKFTEDHKKRISDSSIGHIAWNKDRVGVYSDETINKMSESKTGNKHPNWKGGISCEPYCDVWLDKDFKESIKNSDDNKCQNPLCEKK